MKQRKFLVSMIALLICCALMLTACSNTGSTTTPGPDSSENVSTDTNTGNGGGITSQDVTATEVTSVQRSSINIGVQADISSFNPWAAGNTGYNESIWGIYECLAEYDSGVYYPVLAKSWEVSEDRMSIDVEIFDYIYDTNGNHMTVDDIIFSQEMCIANIGAEQLEIIESLEKTSDYTFTWHLKKPLQVGGLKVLLTYFRVTQKSFEDSPDDMITTPVGTGPYMLKSHTDGYSFTYVKNENYWQKDPNYIIPRSMANVDTINYYVISETSQRTVALESGTIDACASVSTSDLSKFDDANGKWLSQIPANTSLNLLPNFDPSNICSDVNLRKAIFYAVDNKTILSSVYGGNGLVLYEHAPSWCVDYNPDWETEDNYYQYNPDTAKEYLAKSGYDGETLRIICATDEYSKNAAELIQNFLLQVGISAEVDAYEGGVFNSYIQDPAMWDLMVKTYPASLGYFVQAVHSTLSQTRYSWGGGANFIVDDELEALIQLCMEEGSPAENTERLHDYLIENAVIKGLVNPTTSFVLPDWITTAATNQRKGIYAGGCTYSVAE